MFLKLGASSWELKIDLGKLEEENRMLEAEKRLRNSQNNRAWTSLHRGRADEADDNSKAKRSARRSFVGQIWKPRGDPNKLARATHMSPREPQHALRTIVGSETCHFTKFVERVREHRCR